MSNFLIKTPQLQYARDRHRPTFSQKINGRNVPENTSYEVGTVIAVGVSRQKITIAADSRSAWLTTKSSSDGTARVIDKITYNDCACKITQLTPALLFAADGQVTSTNPTLPANALFDAHKLARLAAKNYQPNSDPVAEKLVQRRHVGHPDSFQSLTRSRYMATR
jgi:hypothetical protein